MNESPSSVRHCDGCEFRTIGGRRSIMMTNLEQFVVKKYASETDGTTVPDSFGSLDKMPEANRLTHKAAQTCVATIFRGDCPLFEAAEGPDRPVIALRDLGGSNFRLHSTE